MHARTPRDYSRNLIIRLALLLVIGVMWAPPWFGKCQVWFT